MTIRKFEDLEIWKKALVITKIIYDLTSTKEFSRDFDLRSQIRRTVISISSNIVEGFEKNNNNEFIRYLKIAKGSMGEVRNQLYIALTVCHISKNQFEDLNEKLIELAGKIGKFITYLEDQRNKGNFKTRKPVNSSTR